MNIEVDPAIQKIETIILLYKEVIKQSDLAAEAISANRAAEKSEALEKIENIILELNSHLDHEKGGDIAKNLAALYDYVLYQVTIANVKSDSSALDNVKSTIFPLLEGWVGLKEQLQTQA